MAKKTQKKRKTAATSPTSPWPVKINIESFDFEGFLEAVWSFEDGLGGLERHERHCFISALKKSRANYFDEGEVITPKGESVFQGIEKAKNLIFESMGKKRFHFFTFAQRGDVGEAFENCVDGKIYRKPSREASLGEEVGYLVTIKGRDLLFYKGSAADGDGMWLWPVADEKILEKGMRAFLKKFFIKKKPEPKAKDQYERAARPSKVEIDRFLMNSEEAKRASDAFVFWVLVDRGIGNYWARPDRLNLGSGYPQWLIALIQRRWVWRSVSFWRHVFRLWPEFTEEERKNILEAGVRCVLKWPDPSDPITQFEREYGADVVGDVLGRCMEAYRTCQFHEIFPKVTEFSGAAPRLENDPEGLMRDFLDKAKKNKSLKSAFAKQFGSVMTPKGYEGFKGAFSKLPNSEKAELISLFAKSSHYFWKTLANELGQKKLK
jgi:hypothetical protein